MSTFAHSQYLLTREVVDSLFPFYNDFMIFRLDLSLVAVMNKDFLNKIQSF